VSDLGSSLGDQMRALLDAPRPVTADEVLSPGTRAVSAQAIEPATRGAPHRRTARIAIACFSIAVLVAGIVIGIDLGTRTRTTSTIVAHEPSLLLRELWTIRQGGDLDPGSGLREAVGPVRGSLAEEVTMGAGGGSDAPVYVIEVQGSFTCSGRCSRPGAQGGKPPSYTVSIDELDATSLLDIAFSGGDRWVSLTPLGKPFVLPRPPDGAEYWNVPTGAIVTSFTGRWSAAGAEMTLGGLSGQSSITWANGRDVIDFTFDSAGYGVAGVFPSVAAGAVTSDDVGIPETAGIVLMSHDGELYVTVTPAPTVSIPGPFRP
jgi:hypothetical protein